MVTYKLGISAESTAQDIIPLLLKIFQEKEESKYFCLVQVEKGWSLIIHMFFFVFTLVIIIIVIVICFLLFLMGILNVKNDATINIRLSQMPTTHTHTHTHIVVNVKKFRNNPLNDSRNCNVYTSWWKI